MDRSGSRYSAKNVEKEGGGTEAEIDKKTAKTAAATINLKVKVLLPKQT